MLSFPQVPVVDVRDVLITRQADRLEAAEKLIDLLVKQAEWNRNIRDSVDNLLALGLYKEDSSPRHQIMCMNFDALTAAKQWKDGK